MFHMGSSDKNISIKNDTNVKEHDIDSTTKLMIHSLETLEILNSVSNLLLPRFRLWPHLGMLPAEPSPVLALLPAEPSPVLA